MSRKNNLGKQPERDDVFTILPGSEHVITHAFPCSFFHFMITIPVPWEKNSSTFFQDFKWLSIFSLSHIFPLQINFSPFINLITFAIC